MPKMKYQAPTQAREKMKWNGFEIQLGDIYGRDSFGLYIVKPCFKQDETRAHHFQMYRRIANKINNEIKFAWVLVEASDASDKTLRKIMQLYRENRLFLRDYFRDSVYYSNAIKARKYIAMNGATAFLRGEKEFPQTSRAECLTKKHYKVSQVCNKKNLHFKSPEYLYYSYKLYGTKSIYENRNSISNREMDYLDGAFI